MYSIMFSSIMLVVIVYMLFVMLFYKSMFEMESVSSYECGFNPNSSTRLNFSYRFFLISILFIIFDVEIALLLPIPLIPFHTLILWIFSFFLLVLVLGLLYEYTWGSLDWLY